jgi:hypothetical protein
MKGQAAGRAGWGVGILRKMLYTVPQSEATDGRATAMVAFYSLSFKIKRIVQEEARLSG